ncbi:MAG: hypothetical protein JWN98_1239 [Abditibacteriota bacterium]|nr:hypothetical protein [Abditibacteriota bacterium]
MQSRLQSTLVATVACGVSLITPVMAAPAAKAGAAKPVANAAAKPVGPAGVAAEVNSDRILIADVTRMLDSLKAAEPALSGESAEAKKALSELRNQVLNNLIEHRLMVQEARRLKIAPTKAEVDKAFDEFKKQFPNEATFKQVVAKEGKTPEDLRRLISEGLQVFEIGRQWGSDVTVNDDEMGKFYRENVARFALPEGINVRHILIATAPKATQAEKDKARARAQELLKQAQGGADFAKLAAANSDDPGSKNEGGSLGWITRDTPFIQPFLDAAFKATVGQITSPVETEFGYHLIKVDERKAAGTMPLADAKRFIKPMLMEQKQKQRLDEKTAALKAKANIKKYI